MAVTTQLYSVEEYLEQEQQAEFRSEYHDGEVVPMSGGSPHHNQLAGNLYAALNYAFRSKPYRVFMSDMRLWIPDDRRFTYPDVVIFAADLEMLEGRRDTLLNPLVITEVLSESTERYDRGEKFKMYRSIPSFAEYLLISQTGMLVEHYVKGNKVWHFSDYDQAEDVLRLASVPFEIMLKELYDKVTFDKEKD